MKRPTQILMAAALLLTGCAANEVASRPDYTAQRNPLTGSNIPKARGTMPINGAWPDHPDRVASDDRDSTGLVAVNPSSTR